MPIRFKVDINQFVSAVKQNETEPSTVGDIVFAWDKGGSNIVVGRYLGRRDKYDAATGQLLEHRYAVLILSWSDPTELTFDMCVHYPDNSKPLVITKHGTGIISRFRNDGLAIVKLHTGCYECFNESEVKLFDWDKICNAETSND
jgi:hypothetical protein